MSEFSALAPCAQSAVSYGVLSQTYDLCPEGPQALASCACLKSAMSGFVSNDVSSDVKYYCDSTATEDVSSALQVFELYCSAAKGLVTPAGITESVEQTIATGSNGASGPKETGVTGESGSSGSTSADEPKNSGVSAAEITSKSNVGMIVGVVIGVVAAIAAICFIIFFFRKRSQRNQGQDQAAAPSTGPEGSGKPELDGTGAGLAGGISPSTLKAETVSRVDNVSPISAYSSPNTSELPGQNIRPLQPHMPQVPELYAQSQPSPHAPQEAYGQQIYEASGQHQPQVYEAQGQPRSELQGVSWQSGPVAPFYEMDGTHRS
ncbi:hypothetical protein Hte_002134 [Hypoxylon texense]